MQSSPLSARIGVAVVIVLASATGAAAAQGPHAVFPARPEAAGQPLGPNAILFDTSVGGIHVVNSDGTGYRNLVPEVGPRRPQWSPDGKRIVYEKTRDFFGSARPSNPIIVMNADGQRRTMVARGSSPAWSADGTEIYFTRSTYLVETPPGELIHAVNVRTRKKRVLPVRGATLRSRDGTMMAAGGDNRPNRGLINSDRAYTVFPVDGSAIFSFLVPRRPAFGTRQTWAPGGSFLYSCIDSSGRSVSDICMFDPVRKRLRVLPSPAGIDEYEADFSPSGRAFAASGTDGIYVRNLRSGRVTWLWRSPGAGQTNSHAPFSPSWRPTGR